MPTHGYGPFRRFLLGSVTAKVLHDVDCPVWTGPHLEQAPQWKSVRRVACALDLGPHSRQCSSGRRGWPRILAELVLHAIPAPPVSAHAGLRPDCLKMAEEARTHIELAEPTPCALPTADGDRRRAGRGQSRRPRRRRRPAGDRPQPGDGVRGRLRANAYSIIREAPCPVVSIEQSCRICTAGRNAKVVRKKPGRRIARLKATEKSVTGIRRARRERRAGRTGEGSHGSCPRRQQLFRRAWLSAPEWLSPVTIGGGRAARTTAHRAGAGRRFAAAIAHAGVLES